MKNVLVLIHHDPGQEARLQAALDIVRAIGGHLQCVSVKDPFAAPGVPFGAGGELLMVANRAAELARQNKSRIQARLAHEDVPWDWVDVEGDLAHALLDNVALADLIVSNSGLEGFGPDMRAVAAGLITQSGKPVVAVPEQATGFDVGGRALVAWDGSREAVAALSAAVPLLKLAASVTILEVDDGKLLLSVADAAPYLLRHGIGSELSRRGLDGWSVAAVIAGECWRRKIAWCAMGGFGRPRLVEALIGGVTREMLAMSAVPLFIAHR